MFTWFFFLSLKVSFLFIWASILVSPLEINLPCHKQRPPSAKKDPEKLKINLFYILFCSLNYKIINLGSEKINKKNNFNFNC